MAYTTKDATQALFDYMSITENDIEFIEDTSKRGFIYRHPDSEEDIVIFIYPISHKADNSKNFFDTRDSGAYERGVTWNYAIQNHMKYFCVAVHSEVDRYKDYVFSLECNEKTVEKVSGTVDGIRAGKGTQVVIPNDFIPQKGFERILTKNGFFIAVVHRNEFVKYLGTYDNRPYLLDNDMVELPLEDVNNPNFDELLQINDNKDFIFTCLDVMKNHNLFTEENLSILSDKDKCASMFRHNCFNGIMFKLNEEEDFNEQKKDENGSSRYYSDNYEIGADKYAVSSQWRPVTATENPRAPFVEWIKSQFLEIKFETGLQSDFSRNRILFGAPGTGKSYRLNEEREALLGENKDTNYERVTFHPDYTYSQFVGTYKPVTDADGKIKYSFVPGPFMRVYVEALKSGRTDNPEPHLLIIEEINRAKVAAVFGDVFQLLDRDDFGVSEYPVQASEDIMKYLSSQLGGQPEAYKIIKLPDNMFIWATMNSADQGVFPMDTAFKRRWDFEYLGINENDSEIKGTITIGSSSTQEVEWNKLRKAINDKLSKDYKVNEDKLMGPFFISKKLLKTVSETDNTIADADRFKATFKSKVIMYLYEDAAKQHKHKLFSGCSDTTKYSEVCKSFDDIGMKIFGDDFEEDYYNTQEG